MPPYGHAFRDGKPDMYFPDEERWLALKGGGIGPIVAFPRRVGVRFFLISSSSRVGCVKGRLISHSLGSNITHGARVCVQPTK